MDHELPALALRRSAAPRADDAAPRRSRKEEARDVAAFLGSTDDAIDLGVLAGASAERGRTLMEAKGCPSCHAFTGIAPLEGASNPKDLKGLASGVALAPDFRTTRKRMTPAAVLTWIKDPKAMKADTAMPELALTDAEVKDLAAFVLTTKLEAAPTKKVPERLPLLDRKVGFDEVAERVFRRSCWHCHGEPEYAVGDGGPGNTGGFGFKPRGLALTDYANVASGLLDDKGERRSAFEKLADGTPRMLAAVLARQDEEAGHPHGQDLRGMPLGYPSLSPLRTCSSSRAGSPKVGRAESRRCPKVSPRAGWYDAATMSAGDGIPWGEQFIEATPIRRLGAIEYLACREK